MLHSRPLWLTLLCACFLVGGAAAWRDWAWRAPHFSDADASLRAVATQHLGTPDALSQLRSFIDTVPRDHTIVVFARHFSWGGSEIFQLTSYLAWPRPVLWSDPSRPPPDATTPVGALAFFDTAPPAPFAGGARRIGEKFSFIAMPPAP